jgi:hypothetical protein
MVEYNWFSGGGMKMFWHREILNFLSFPSTAYELGLARFLIDLD